jgi:general secretion pathway protein H
MKNRGFSLIEVIIVLILISLSISLVAPSLSRFSMTVELKGAAKKVSAILRYCRSEAVNQGKVYQVLFNSELREVRVQTIEGKEEDAGTKDKATPKIYPLPKGVDIKEVKVTSPENPSEIPTIEFYPNGGSNGGTILLDSRDRKGYRINIHFITGMVTVEKV